MQRKQIHIVFNFAFLLLLFIPGITIFFPQTNASNCEKRNLNQFPKFEFSKNYLNSINNYISDNFGGRSSLTKLGANFTIKLFNSSINIEKTVVGEDGWYFLTDFNDAILPSYTHSNLLSESELYNFTYKYRTISRLLDKNNAQLYLAVWPNKSSIYDEFLPSSLKKIQQDTLSKLDQVIEYNHKNNLGLNISDVRKVLNKEKTTTKLYHQHDTHWNSYGAFLAYQQFIINTKLPIKPYSLEDFEIKWETTFEGDLIEAMGICNNNTIHEIEPIFTLKDKSISIEETEGDFKYSIVTKNNNAKRDEKVVVFKDSYTNAIQPFLSLHFKEVYYIWTDYNQEVINQLSPDIVIISKVERYF